MDKTLKEKFMKLWTRYFGGSELPLTFYYSDKAGAAEVVPERKDRHCLICDLARARAGHPLAFARESFGCPGGCYYAGFEEHLRPGIEHFLSTGIPGKMEGERYKKTPELALEAVSRIPELQAEGKYIVFKRWDNLDTRDEPQVVIFFATPDVLSGLFTLANFDETSQSGVVTAFSSGCAAIIRLPLAERRSEHPRAFLGMFDVSARPCVPANVLTFAVPMAKFVRMIDNMPESFLITHSWEKVKERIGKS